MSDSSVPFYARKPVRTFQLNGQDHTLKPLKTAHIRRASKKLVLLAKSFPEIKKSRDEWIEGVVDQIEVKRADVNAQLDIELIAQMVSMNLISYKKPEIKYLFEGDSVHLPETSEAEEIEIYREQIDAGVVDLYTIYQLQELGHIELSDPVIEPLFDGDSVVVPALPTPHQNALAWFSAAYQEAEDEILFLLALVLCSGDELRDARNDGALDELIEEKIALIDNATVQEFEAFVNESAIPYLYDSLIGTELGKKVLQQTGLNPDLPDQDQVPEEN